MTELSKDNDQESSYKEAFRSQITLQQSKSQPFISYSITSHAIQGDFFTGPKNLKYGQPRLGESTVT